MACVCVLFLFVYKLHGLLFDSFDIVFAAVLLFILEPFLEYKLHLL